jgi:hypothetical protein
MFFGTQRVFPMDKHAMLRMAEADDDDESPRMATCDAGAALFLPMRCSFLVCVVCAVR